MSLFKTQYYLLVHPDPIHNGVYWRLYNRRFIYRFFLKAQCAEGPALSIYHNLLTNKRSTDKQVEIFSGDGYMCIGIMGFKDWMDSIQGDDHTTNEFKMDCKIMKKTKLTKTEVEEFLFTEAL